MTIGARRSDARLKALVHYSALVIMALFCVGLIAVMFVTSFKTQVQTFNTGLTLFFAPTMENYRDVIFDASFGRYLIYSVIVGVVATAITLLLGFMAAYGMALLVCWAQNAGVRHADA